MKALPILTVLSFFLFSCATDKTHDEAHGGRFMKVNGKQLYYEQSGKGIPLLLLCGGGLHRSIEDFKLCIPDLSSRFNVIVVDTPGQGKSESPDSVSYQSITDTMSEFIDSLKVDSLYVMGWSDGGIVSIMLAAEKEKVKKVIAVGPNNGKAGFNLPPGTPIESVTPPSPEYYEQHNEETIKKYMETPGRDWRKITAQLSAMWYANEYFPTSTYSLIKAPVMIVLGDQDDISIPHGLEMSKAIKNGSFCVLPNTTHEVFKERPTWITEIAIDFFESKPKKDQTSN